MDTVTIIIYDYDSIPFLKGCMRQVLKYKHPDIEQRIIISEQGNVSTFTAVKWMFPEADVYYLPPLGSGYAIDWIMRNANITSDFVCTLDVDAFPIHKNWLKVPITLIKENGYSFAGVHADIDSAYGGGFFCMCQYFRVGRTIDFIRLSLGGGFTKWDRRPKTGMIFDDYHWTRGWSDDSVIAHWWEDKMYANNKLTFATLQYLDVAPSEGRYGRNTDDLVFHFAFSYNWTQCGKKTEALGLNYLEWIRRINESNFSAELLDEMLSKLIPLEQPIYRRLWNGATKTWGDLPAELHKLIDELKCE